MTTATNDRYCVTKGFHYDTDSTVTDTYTGTVVFKGSIDAAHSYAHHHNSGSAQEVAITNSILSNLVAKELKSHPLPWYRVETIGVRSGVSSFHVATSTRQDEAHIIVTFDNVEAADYVIELAQQLKPEDQPDGRPRD